MRVTGLEGTVRQISSPYAVGGETGYTAHEDLKSINGYNMGEGKADNGLVFLFLHSKKTLVGFICSFALGSPQEIDREKPSTTKQLNQTERIKKKTKQRQGESHTNPTAQVKNTKEKRNLPRRKARKETSLPFGGAGFVLRENAPFLGSAATQSRLRCQLLAPKTPLTVLFPDRGGIRC